MKRPDPQLVYVVYTEDDKWKTNRKYASAWRARLAFTYQVFGEWLLALCSCGCVPARKVYMERRVYRFY